MTRPSSEPLPIYSIVVRPISEERTGFGAASVQVDGLTPIQALIDAVSAGTATKSDADAAEAGVIQIQQNANVAAPTSTFSWQNIMLGFAGGIFATSLAFAAFGDLSPSTSRSRPSRSRSTPRRMKPRHERTTIRPRLARA